MERFRYSRWAATAASTASFMLSNTPQSPPDGQVWMEAVSVLSWDTTRFTMDSTTFSSMFICCSSLERHRIPCDVQILFHCTAGYADAAHDFPAYHIGEPAAKQHDFPGSGSVNAVERAVRPGRLAQLMGRHLEGVGGIGLSG